MKKEIDPARLEEIMASGGTRKTICEEFGISHALIDQRFKKEPELRAAYDRGRARAKEAKKNHQAPLLSAEDADVLDAVEAFGSNGATWGALKRVETIRHLDDTVLGARLVRLEEAGRIHLEHIGVAQTPTYFAGPGEGRRSTDTKEEEAVEDDNRKSGSKRAARKSTTKKRAAKKRASKKASRRPAIEADSLEYNGPGGARRLTADTFNALEAAYVELSYVQHWGEPSPRCADVLMMLARGRQSAS